MKQPENATVSDTDLVRRAKAGELDAFEELTYRYENLVYSLARRIVKQDQDAEDVTQTTFLSAVDHLDSFREESSFGTWLTRIATHAALKILRKRNGLPTVSWEALTESEEGYEGIPHPEFIADWRQDPSALVARQEITQLVDNALLQLEDKHRLVFVLRDVEGFSIRETAETLGISEANVKVRLLRARLQLREELTRVLGDESKRLLHAPHDHP
jgi:RNA polymerase sigma-70 factor (ECF subfamily)